MRSLNPVHRLWHRAWTGLVLSWYRKALKDLQSMNAAHPDVPKIVLAIRKWQDKYGK